MKFYFADSLDYVDPGYDFIRDETTLGRQPYWDDQYPHEILDSAPYDGILVSRATVGDDLTTGHYTESQAMRFRRDGARRFLRFDNGKNARLPVMADCGAFSYVKEDRPPYKVDDTIEFYEDGQFTYGCSIDHVIFDYFEDDRCLADVSEKIQFRFQVTLDNAEAFLRESEKVHVGFEPIGIAQGWSANSIATATKTLIDIGYKYIAIGGMVPLGSAQICRVLDAIGDKVSRAQDCKLHILGFAKADQLHEFKKYSIYSFDTTSPLLRAFKDNVRNYYQLQNEGGLDYFTAIRIPSTASPSVQRRLIKPGKEKLEDLVAMEGRALMNVRKYTEGQASIDEAVDAVIDYSRKTTWSEKVSDASNENRLEKLAVQYRRTLTEKPWLDCSCAVCRTAGIEVMLFRGSNRNKRRGIHNLFVYHQHLQAVMAA
jgi:hypothetical protein